MAGANSQVGGHDSKRRKVRKGTQSCWECRRRKVRCIFAATTDAICKNCKRRGTACNSQEHPDEPILSVGSNQVEARLGRVEQLIEHLVDNNIPNSNSQGKQLSCTDIPTPVESEAAPGDSLGCSDRNTVHHLNTGEPTLPRPHLKRFSPNTITSSIQSRRATAKYDELSRALTMAWPSQRDIDIICALPVGLSAQLHGGICTPYSSSMDRDLPSPREMLQLPPPGSHLVLIARKLLLLGTFLQGIPPASIRELGNLGVFYRDLMSHVVDTAISLVTTNEDLIGSIEGIECIMIEAMYQNYAGNLHRAWMAVRRAASVAEMMALHRGLNSPSLKILEPETRKAFNPDQICFRLVELDCYLSIMLGLPRTSLEARFATPKAMEGCQPIDRMQRIHCSIASRILQRNETNLSETYDIDTILQKAAAEMPPQWWLIPNFSTSNGTEVLHETVRLMDQFSHYHLLIRLHLPYMLCSSSDHRYYHSKITAVNVSRETLARFVAFRTSNPAEFYCRGIDFFAFIATTVLCLAYIDSRNQYQGPVQNSNPSTVFSFLAHSRPSDRGMMERTLDIIESMAHDGTDIITSKIACILRPLLVIEADAASGTSYSTNSSKSHVEELECHGKLTNGGKGLYVHIPYFGTINFESRAISKSVSTASEQGLQTALVADVFLPDELDYHDAQTGDNFQQGQLPVSVGFGGAEDEWDLQGVDVALFDSLFRGTTFPDAVEENT